MLAPLIEAGWTFRDFEQHTQIELNVAATLLKRRSILQGYEPTAEDLKNNPNLVKQKISVIEEREKLERWS